jgi:hypothetical protein
MWDNPIMHRKTGGLPKWKFGCPEIYAALDWARAYKGFLENWATITKALARFAYQIETQGGQQAIQQFSQILSTTLGDGGTQIETNPPPVVGASFVSGPGNKITPVKTQGATTDPEKGRRVLLMLCAATGLPETFFGDASTGSLATAMSLDRPTELQFLQRQELWREILIEIVKYALVSSATAPGGKLREAKKAGMRVVESRRVHLPSGRWVYEAKSAKSKQSATPEEIRVKVVFPSVLEHDIGAQVNAITVAMTLDNKAGQIVGVDERIGVGLLLQELGVEDVDAVLETMYPTKGADKYDPDRTKQDIAAPLPTSAGQLLSPGGVPQNPGGAVQAPGQTTPTPARPAAPGTPGAPAAPPANGAPKESDALRERAIQALLKASQRWRLEDER